MGGRGSAGQTPCGHGDLFSAQARRARPLSRHKVDATEIWHFHVGAPLLLRPAATEAGPVKTQTLVPHITRGHRPQGIVATGHWQAAATTGDWGLVGCTVSPGFRLDGFTLAPPGFDIPG